jgi:hypothetical protein
MSGARPAYARALPAIAILALASDGATAATASAVTPSTYDVSSSDGVRVVYTTAGEDGRPQLTYESSARTLSFHGDEIRTVPADVGTLVSVTIRRTIDTGSTSFTLMIPRVRLPVGQTESEVEVVGITTRHRFSVVPRFNLGQLDEYGEVTLKGTARTEAP